MNTGVGSLFLLQRIFLTQESNQGLLESLSAELLATPCMCVCVFVYVYVCVCVYTSYFLYPFIRQWSLGCFYVFVVVNSAGINIGVHVSFQIRIFSRCVPKSGIAGSYGNYF